MEKTKFACEFVFLQAKNLQVVGDLHDHGIRLRSDVRHRVVKVLVDLDYLLRRLVVDDFALRLGFRHFEIFVTAERKTNLCRKEKN